MAVVTADTVSGDAVMVEAGILEAGEAFMAVLAHVGRLHMVRVLAQRRCGHCGSLRNFR